MKALLRRISMAARGAGEPRSVPSLPMGKFAPLAEAPGSAKTHEALSQSYQAIGDLDSAEAALRRAIDLEPSLDSAHNALGVVLYQLNRAKEAHVSFETAVRINPANFEAQNNLGNECMDAGDLVRAELCYRNALAIKPGFVQAHMNLGILLKRQVRLDEAAACYEFILQREPANADALNNIGAVHLAAGRLVEAEDALRRALETNPRLIEAHCNLADTLLGLDRTDEAEACCRAALALQPRSVSALNTLGMIFKRSDLDRAEAFCRQAIAIDPHHASSHNTLGTILRGRGDHASAEAEFRAALGYDPDVASAQYNLATSLLLRGDYECGFDLYESRFAASPHRAGSARGFERVLGRDRRWRGQPLAARRIVVWTEQGFGDSLMMLRYVSLLRSAGAGAILIICEPPLARLAATMPGVDRVISGGDELSRADFDFQCPIMSLAHAFGTRRDSVPHEIPYLCVPQDLSNRWRRRFEGITIPKVGIAWAGSSLLEADAQRNIPLATLAPLLQVSGVRFFSLQKSDGLRDRAELPLLDWMSECTDFMDTAALMENLDLVISVDTAVAHLAGALGKEIWLLNRLESEWRWGLDEDRSAWYPTLRLFRQVSRGDWDEIIGRVGFALRRRLCGASPETTPG
jgi:tetratricopeptide (TPR) repeat protein